MAIASPVFPPVSLPPSVTPIPTKQRSYRLPRSFCTIPSSALIPHFHSPRLQCCSSAQPITASVKENLGLIKKINWSHLSSFNSCAIQECNGLGRSNIDVVPQIWRLTDEKFRCRWRKDETLTDIQDCPITENSRDTESLSKKRETYDAARRTWRKFRPKLYKIIVVPAASISVALVLCYFALLPKLRTSRSNVVPYSDLIVGIEEGSVTRVQFVENSRRISFNTKSGSFENAQASQGNSLARATQDASHDGIQKNQAYLANMLRKISKNKDSGSTSNIDEDNSEPLRNEASIPAWQYSTRNIDDDKYELLVLLKEKGITYGSDPGLLSVSAKDILITVLQQLPYWVMVLLTCYQLSAQLSIGKSPARKPSKDQKVTFADVEGVDAAKVELMEIVSCMEGDSKYKKLGAKLPRGVLLSGPPGTGKTLLARAVAGEAGVAYFSISASELVEVYVGRGAARVRDLFREARKHAPSIIFIDEIDAVGGHRGRTLNCERDQTLNQLLTEMDGFEKDENVIVIAATNRPETLDSALLRPGRFSRKVVVGEPDEDGRRKILAVHLRPYPLEEDKDVICNLVASLTQGLVGADLANIVNEAVLLAARRGGDVVSRKDILQAMEREKSKVYDHVTEPKPFPFGPTSQDRMESDVGALGFGTLG